MYKNSHMRRIHFASSILVGLLLLCGDGLGETRRSPEKPSDGFTTPADVQSDNSSPRLGKVPAVAWQENYLDADPLYSDSKLAKATRDITEKYLKWSHGKTQMVNHDGTGDQFGYLTAEQCELPFNKGEESKGKTKNQAWAYLEKKHNIGKDAIRWKLRKHNPNSGGNSFNATAGAATYLHECGHVMHLGHGSVLRYDKRDDHKNRVWMAYDDYGDRTTVMGRNGGKSYNLPQLHRLGWIEPKKVAVFTQEKSGTVYRIHDIYDFSEDTYRDPTKVAGVVYYLPITGNRLWISINERKVYQDQYFGDSLAMSKYVTDYHKTSGMKGTLCIDQKTAGHTDDFGLTYRMVKRSPDGSKNKWVDIKITYNKAHQRRTLPLQITPTFRVLQSPAPGRRGEVEVTLKIFNPNPRNTTPFLTTRGALTVPNSNRVSFVYGTRSWEKREKPVKRGQLHPIFPAQTTGYVAYKVTSKAGPLKPEQARGTGSYRLAHMQPFRFPIEFK